MSRHSDAVKGRMMLAGLSLAWGLSWPAMRFALVDIPPFAMRAISAAIGAGAVFALARLAGRRVRMLPLRAWPDVMVISLFNIVIFSMCITFAQLLASTGRVAVLTYTMPIWASLLARVALGERLTAARTIALLLCAVGMVVLIAPLAASGVPAGLLLALAAAVSWAIGTVYLKWRRIALDPIALAVWQFTVSAVVIGCFVPVFEASFRFSQVRTPALAGLLFSGLFGSGAAYFLWFSVIRLMPVATASLGALAAPVIGVVSSAILLREIPTVPDIVGFVLIFSASACVLLQPGAPTRRQPEHT